MPKTGTGDRWHAVPAGVCHHLRDDPLQINPTDQVLICIQLNPSIKNKTTHADLTSFPHLVEVLQRDRSAPAHTAVVADLVELIRPFPGERLLQHNISSYPPYCRWSICFPVCHSYYKILIRLQFRKVSLSEILIKTVART